MGRQKRPFPLGHFRLRYPKNYDKSMVYLGEKIDCPAVGDVSGYSIEMKINDEGQYYFKSNLGYNVSSLKDAAKVAIFSRTEGWNNLISERYSLYDNVPIRIDIDEQTNLPSIVLDQVLAVNTKSLRKMVEDALTGHIAFEIQPAGNVYVPVKSEIDNYVGLYTEVRSWINNPKISAQDIYKLLTQNFKGWRETLVRLEMYEQLERIDSECFILNR